MLKTIHYYNAARAFFSAYAACLAVTLVALVVHWAMPGFIWEKGAAGLPTLAFSQLSHLNDWHLALNLLGLWVVCWGFAGVLRPLQQSLVFLLAFPWVGVYLMWVEPLQWYAGLSGALHFVFACYLMLAWIALPTPRLKATRRWRQHWPLLGLTAGLLAKLAWEAFGVPIGYTDPLLGAPVAFEAHRAGAIGGLLMGLLLGPYRARPGGSSAAHQQQCKQTE